MSTIDEIKSKIDIVELATEAGVKLRKAGRNYTGFCPFHDNKNTPAFVIWPETGTWRCFGQCNEGGDIFKFVMKREGLDFKDALQKLADRAGVKVESFQREAPQVKEANEHLRTLLEDAIIFYRSHLFNNRDVLTYLREKRNLTDATIETFGLGYAPSGWDTALKHFTAKGYNQQDLIDAGLLTVREAEDEQQAGRVYDRFRHRIMIPIRDENGKMAGFGARIVDPNDIPKFLNSPETPIFSKGRLLYGLDRARKPIRAADQAVIVEGYLDVIAVHQAGYENVVSPMGTALTEDQLRLLKKFSKNIVLALDPDVAGQKAVLRGLEAARGAFDSNAPTFDQGGLKQFDAPGLMRFAKRLDSNITVTALPDNLDPDEIVARDKDEWGRIVSSAKPIVIHVMDTLLVERNINDPKVKSQIVDELTPLIESISDSVERDDYRQRLARRLQIDERVLIPLRFGNKPQGPVLRRRPRTTEPTSRVEAPLVAAIRPGQKIESQALGVLYRKPELCYRLDRLLEEASLGALAPEDFEYTDHQLLFRIIRQSLEQVEAEHHAFVAARVPETLQGLAKELLAQTEKLDPVDDRLLEELFRNVVKMRRLVVEQNFNQLRFIQEEAQQDGDLRVKNYQELALQYSRLRNTLDRAFKKVSARK